MEVIMNIFIRELKANRKALIIWSICMVLLVLSGMSKYTAYSGGGVSSDVFSKMPDTLKALLGMSSLDVTSMNGFYAFLFLYIELTAGIHAVLLGSNIIAKEERDKTTEFIIVKPVSRLTIITQKLLAALVNVAIFNIVTLLSSLMAVSAFNKGKSINSELILFDLSLFFVQLIFLTLGAMLAALLKKPKAAGSIGSSILLIGYAIYVITNITDRLDLLKVLSPFKYFSYTELATGKGLNVLIIFLTLILSAGFSIMTYYFYKGRDLNV